MDQRRDTPLSFTWRGNWVNGVIGNWVVGEKRRKKKDLSLPLPRVSKKTSDDAINWGNNG